jgi:hypothetical protein
MGAALFLTPDLFVAEGTDRQCYRHPEFADRCIKILHAGRRSGRLWREIAYFKSLQRRCVDLTHLTRYHGVVETSLGSGAVFDLVCDDDGRISTSLAARLASDDAGFDRWAVAEIERLKANFYQHWIVFHDLNPTNLLVQRLGYDSFRLVVIDGIGHNHFLPLASLSPRFARKKIRRAWNRRYHEWYSPWPRVEAALTPFPV